MEQAILLLHLFLVIFLIALILLQRSEGGALGIGGGGGGVMTGRSATTALQKTTWYLAAGFLATSLTLTVLAQSGRSGDSVVTEDDEPVAVEQALPPALGEDAPALPPALGEDAPAAGGGDDPALPPQ